MPGDAVRSLNIPSTTMKRIVFMLPGLFAASVLIFFIVGFILYTPPTAVAPYASMTVQIRKVPDEVFHASEDREPVGAEKERGPFAAAAEPLPLLDEQPKKVRMARAYEDVVAQMGSILEDRGLIKVSGSVTSRWGDFAHIEDTYPAYERMSQDVPLETLIQERMVMIGEVLEYASSQMGISRDLLAAVAWAESKMLPYAINVSGKAYYFTSKERALTMLRGLETCNVDIGLFQVNYRLWGEPLGLQKEDLLNSRLCAVIGAMILTYNLQRHRDPWVAIGRYHSGTRRRMRAYQTKVSRGLLLIRRFSLSAYEGEGTEPYGMSRGVRRSPPLHHKARLYS